MVDASRLAGPLRQQPVVAVIIGEGQLAGNKIELRRERAIRTTKVPVVREKDGVEADTSKWRPLVLPGCGHGFDRIIEGHSQRVVPGFDEGLASIPVDADGRLARAVRAGRRRSRRRLDAARRLLSSRAVVRGWIVDESGRSRSGRW